jgi:hypothetical protein
VRRHAVRDHRHAFEGQHLSLLALPQNIGDRLLCGNRGRVRSAHVASGAGTGCRWPQARVLSRLGAHAPDSNARKTVYIVPVGILDDNPVLQVDQHIYVGSKAHWEVIGEDGAPQFEEDSRGPPLPRNPGRT